MNRHPRCCLVALAFALGALNLSFPAGSVAHAQTPQTQRDPAALFQRLDATGDGQLNKDEFKKLAGLGQGKYKDRPEAFDRLFERLDADGNGALSPEEFKNLSGLRERARTLPPPASPKTVAEPATTPAGHRPAQDKFTTATQDATWTDAVRKRDVPVRIYAPELKHGTGPFPTIIVSHGGGESRASFDYLGKHWAGCGYIVVCLTHPGTDSAAVEKGRAGGADRRFELRPQDVRFALEFILSGKTGVKLLDGRVDADRLGIAGQCMGSTTALAMTGLNLKDTGGKGIYADPRFKAAAALSPQPVGERSADMLGLHDGSWATVRGPVLVVTGSKDFLWVKSVQENPAARRRPYDAITGIPKYHVEIDGAEHHAFTDSEPWYPVGGPRDPRHHGWIQQATAAFFDAFLKGDASARAWLDGKQLQAASGGLCRQEHHDGDPNRNAQPAAKESATTGGGFSAVDRFMEQNLARYGGGCGLILIKDGQVVHRRAYGDFTLERVVPIASASKWISACVIMALVDEGKLSLDDKASKYLPEFTGKKGEITIRQMFSHTHGFGADDTPHRDTKLTLAQAVSKIAAMPLEYDPGTALLYSGAGMQVAGRIATLATGKPWEQLFREKIGGPCEMKSTDYYAFGPTRNPNVAGSVQTCLDDYGNLVTMLLGKGVFKDRRVLSEQAVAEMFRNQTGDVPIRRQPYQPYREADPRVGEWRYGIGCWLEEMDPATGRAARASSGGAFGCQPFVDFGQGLAGVYLPCCRNMKRDFHGTHNEATVVYLELKPVIAAALGAKPATVAAPAKPAPAAIIGIEEVRLRDPQRNKELPVRIVRPQETDGKFPVILFSHYAGGSATEYDRLAAHWADHGFVCLLPNHADSPAVGGQRGSQALQGWRERAADLRFLLDSLDAIERAAPVLRGQLDRDRIGIGGHYIGAHSAGLLAGMKVFDPDGKAETFADPHVKSVLMLSPTGRGQGLTDQSWAGMRLPMLVITGSNDVSRRTGNDPKWRTEPFLFAPPGDKYLIFLEGLDGAYGGLVGKQPRPGDLAAYVQTSTLAFWNAYLKGDAKAKAWLQSDAAQKDSNELAEVTHK